jgi:hypothetical protein
VESSWKRDETNVSKLEGRRRHLLWPFGALLAPCYAEDPKPDPAGIATGDRSTAVDGGGTSFMVSAPTDKSDPDFAKKQKEFEEFQAQSSKEPLAVRLADSVGHLRVGTNFAWTLKPVIWSFYASGLHCSPADWSARECGPSDDAESRMCSRFAIMR